MDQVFIPVLVGVGLHAGWNGVSNMASAVLRSQGPLKGSPAWPRIQASAVASQVLERQQDMQ